MTQATHNMIDKVTLGIDIGTSSVKALALSQSGNVAYKCSIDYPTHRNDLGYVEQSPQDWWQAVVQCCQNITQNVPANSIMGVGMCGQLNGFVLLDSHDIPLQNAIIWLDQRADVQTAQIKEAFSDRFIAITGNDSAGISVLSKLKWIADTCPEILQHTHKVMFVKDYITWKLTGIWVTDISDASVTNMMDISSCTWNQELLDYCGIDSTILPPIVPSHHVAGTVQISASTETTLPQGTPVVVGAGDVTSLSVGCAVDHTGTAGVTLGTAGHVVAVSPSSPKQNNDHMWRLSYVDKGKETWLGLIMSGGLSMVWIKNILTGASEQNISFEDFIQQTESVPLGANGVYFLPFLEGTAPPHTHNMRGVLHGLRTHHTYMDIITAVMEGVAFNIKDCINAFNKMGVRIHTIRIAEGGSASSRWCQIIADILQMPVEKIAEQDTSASGGAIIAMHALNGRADISDTIKRMVQVDKVYTPRLNISDQVDDMYAKYTQLVKNSTEA